jgi:hypothetical protein
VARRGAGASVIAALQLRQEDWLMSDVVYRSEVFIERLPGSLRKAHLPAEPQPIFFGTHGAVAEHYGRPPGTFEPHATTLDHVVAATGG